MTHADNACLLGHSRGLAAAQPSPLHALALCTADPGVCAAAWLDRFWVMRTPWEAMEAPVIAKYRCPEVRGLGGGRRRLVGVVWCVCAG